MTFVSHLVVCVSRANPVALLTERANYELNAMIPKPTKTRLIIYYYLHQMKIQNTVLV